MYLDIYHKARTDEQFYEKMTGLCQIIIKYGDRADNAAIQKTADAIQELLKICDYNPGFLVPWLFPRYPKDKPLSMTARPFAFAMLAFITHGYLAIEAARQVAKSTSLVVRQLINQHILPNWKSLYIAPHAKHAETYAKKMDEMRKVFRYHKRDSSLRQNLYYSETKHGSNIEIENVLTTAAHIHGRTADEVLFDEYQFFDAQHESEILQVQSSRDLKVRVYAGTAYTLDSPLHERLEDSTNSTMHIRGPRGWLDFGDKELLLKCISPDGLRCPDTRRKLDVRQGKWVMRNPERVNDRKYGFHIPKLIIPEYVDNIVQWADIYDKFKTEDTQEFLKSTCGFCVDNAGRELNKNDLINMCMSTTRAELVAKARNRKYLYVVSGADWGGSEYDPVNRIKVSYSFHVVIGVLNNGEGEIIHMKRYPGQDYEEVAFDMARYHNYLNGYAFVSDAGAGMGYNKELRKYINPKLHLIVTLLGGNTAPIASVKGLPLSAVVAANKTDALTSVYMSIKRRPTPRLRCYKYDESKDLISDYLNTFRVPTENQAGKQGFRYIRQASKPDDGLMATAFGWIGCRLVLGEPLIPDPAFAEEMRRVFVAGDVMRSRYHGTEGATSFVAG